jgi:site-specific DNA-cytosine methylase
VRVLVACEESGIVTAAFRGLGHEAYSCDILPTSGNHPEWHLQQDVTKLLQDNWDMIVAFPPCTDLAVSGARWFPEKRNDGRQQASIEFFMQFANSQCDKVCIENPIGIMSSQYRKPDQIIQPWQFGHKENKATCLWLKGLPLLRETSNVYSETQALPRGQRDKVHFASPGPDRARMRSRTYTGVAEAMASQWGSF